MTSNLTEVVEEMKKMSLQDKEELRLLLEKIIIEERREEIYQNYKDSVKELQENKLKFSRDINVLKKMEG